MVFVYLAVNLNMSGVFAADVPVEGDRAGFCGTNRLQSLFQNFIQVRHDGTLMHTYKHTQSLFYSTDFISIQNAFYRHIISLMSSKSNTSIKIQYGPKLTSLSNEIGVGFFFGNEQNAFSTSACIPFSFQQLM